MLRKLNFQGYSIDVTYPEASGQLSGIEEMDITTHFVEGPSEHVAVNAFGKALIPPMLFIETKIHKNLEDLFLKFLADNYIEDFDIIETRPDTISIYNNCHGGVL